MNPYISFIVPVYKVEENYLKKCINSLCDINHEDIEIILVDDGSPDNSGVVCDCFEKKDSRIKTYHKKNGGVSSARNYGIANSRGKYITFIDSDDWIDSYKMNTIINYVKKENYDIYIYGQYLDFKNHEPVEVRPFNKNVAFLTKEEISELQKMIFVRDYKSMKTNVGAGVVCNAVDKFIKRELLIKNNCYLDEKFSMGEDALFYLKVFDLCNTVMYIDICSYHYRMRKNSVCHMKNNEGYYNVALFAEEAEKILLKQNKPKEHYEALYYRCIDLIFEQFERTYLLVPSDELNLIKKIKMFNKELLQEPFSQAIKIVKIRNFTIKNGLKVIILKLNMAYLFLLFKIIKRRLRIDDKEVQSYY